MRQWTRPPPYILRARIFKWNEDNSRKNHINLHGNVGGPVLKHPFTVSVCGIRQQ